MFRLLVTKYAHKLVKTKKQAAFINQEKKVEEELPLAEAISKKCDPQQMEDVYNPTQVEKYWNAWW